MQLAVVPNLWVMFSLSYNKLHGEQLWSHFIMEVYWSEENFTSCFFFYKKGHEEKCCNVFRIMGFCMLKIKLEVSSYRPCKHVANVPTKV